VNRASIDTLDHFVIRTAGNADCDRIAALVSGVLSEFNLPFEPESKDSDLGDIEESYLQSGGIFELVEDRSGRLLGTYGLFPLTQETCELRKMYFVAEIRGLGLGKQVLPVGPQARYAGELVGFVREYTGEIGRAHV